MSSVNGRNRLQLGFTHETGKFLEQQGEKNIMRYHIFQLTQTGKENADKRTG